MAVAQKTGTKMEPWQVETWTKTCVTPPPLFNFEPRPNEEKHQLKARSVASARALVVAFKPPLGSSV